MGVPLLRSGKSEPAQCVPEPFDAPGYSPLRSGYFNIPDRLGCNAGGFESKNRAAKTEELNRQDAKSAKGVREGREGRERSKEPRFYYTYSDSRMSDSLISSRSFPSSSLPFLSSRLGDLGVLAVQFFNSRRYQAHEKRPGCQCGPGRRCNRHRRHECQGGRDPTLISCDVGCGSACDASCDPPCGGPFHGGDWPYALLVVSIWGTKELSDSRASWRFGKAAILLGVASLLKRWIATRDRILRPGLASGFRDFRNAE